MCYPRRFCTALCVLTFLCAVPFSAARAQNAPPEAPAYTRLSDGAVLKMSLQDFQYEYGKSSTGKDADDVLFFYAACLARRSDRTARRLAPPLVKKLTLLRKQMEDWDAQKFTPNEQFVGGQLERAHREASCAYEREEMLQKLIPLLAKKKNDKASVDLREGRVEFDKWLKAQKTEVVPLREELEGTNADEKADVRARYADWHKALQAKAKAIRAAAAQMPAPAAEVFLYYAASR